MAAYEIQAGDTLEISVLGAADLKVQRTVAPDGTVSIPLAGRVEVTGRPVVEVERRIKDALSSKVLQQRGPDGRASSLVIDANQVEVFVAEYRPVYVTGDVLTPGEYKFRPGMTLRQVLALAGGATPLRGQQSALLVEAPTLVGQVSALSAELARDKVQLSRLEAELDGRADFAAQEDVRTLVDETLLGGIVKLEADQMRQRQESVQNEKAHVQRVIDRVNSELSTLQKQQQQQQEAVELQTAEVARTRASFEKGVAVANRVSEEQRALNLASERLLETTARIAQSQRALEDLAREQQKRPEDRRLSIIQDMEEARMRVATNEPRLQGLRDRLALATRPGSSTSDNGGVRLLIHRRTANQLQSLPAQQTAELLPGDTVEVTVTRAASPPLTSDSTR